jgi:aminodeoxyfutalosine synthase
MTVPSTAFSSLAASHDIISLGIAADEARRARHGARTTYVRVTDVDAAPGSAFSIPAAAGEIRIIGSPATRAVAIQRVSEVAAGAMGKPVSGYSLADLELLAAQERITLRDLLEQLRAAGLELVAEAPFDRLRDPKRSIEEVNIAGLRLARLTIHQLPTSDIESLYKQIAALQYDVAVIPGFAPLPRQTNPAVPTTGFDDVKRVALARLFLEHVPSIQVDWSLYGPKLAQVALTVGANDVDAVSPLNDLSEGRRRAPVEEIRRNIRAAGLDPIERDGRFDLIQTS